MTKRPWFLRVRTGNNCQSSDFGRGRCHASSSDPLHAKGLQQPRSMWVTGKIWQRLIDCDRFCCCPWYVGLFDNSRLFRVWGQIFVISPARRSLGRTVLQNLYMPFWLWACYGWHVGHVCWLCWPRFWEVFHAVVLVSVKSVGASTWMACEGCFCPAYTIQCNASRF